VAYNRTITMTGGVAPYTFAVVSGALPDCLSLNPGPTTTLATSVLGKPCNSGPFAFTVNVTDSGGLSATQEYTIAVSAPPTLSILTIPAPPVANPGVPYSYAVAVTGGVAPLTWSIVSGSLPPGLSPTSASGLISGVPTAAGLTGSSCSPAVLGTYCFTVQVVDSALIPPDSHHQSPTQAFSITVEPPPALSITTPAGLLSTAGTTGAPYNASLEAMGGVTPYTWSVIQGQLPSGLTLATLNDGTGSISGTPVLAGASTFTVQLSDSYGSTPQTRTFSIAIAAGASNNVLVQGQYAFLFRGFDSDGAVAIAGTFTADGAGNVIAGTQEANRNLTVLTGATLTGCYSVGSDGRGTLELTSAFANKTPLTADYRVALESDGSIRFFQYHPSPAPAPCSNAPAGANADTATRGEGIIKPVLGSLFGANSFSGNYALEFPGQNLSGLPAALAGVVHANGTTQTLTPGTCDFNDAGTYGSQPLSGDFSFLAGNIGTATMTFVVPTKSQITLSFFFFFVSPADLFFIETDADTNFKPTKYRLSGEMILQQSTATFGPTSLAGASVATGTGLDGSNASVFAGLLTSTVCNGIAPVTLAYDENDGGTISTPSFSGTCTVSSNGRASFTGLGSSASQTRAAAAYLTGPGQGFLLGSDSAVTTGLLEQQASGTSFSASSVQGGYTLGATSAADTQVTNFAGQADADGSGNLAGTVDESDPSGTPHLDQALSAAVGSPASNGRGTMTTAAPVPTGFPTSLIFYIVSPGKIRAISADPGDQHPKLISYDH
jgi:hypothetical protein